jgi:hypothetical protein
MHRIIFLAKCLLRSLVRPCLQPAKLHARPAHQRVSLAWQWHPPGRRRYLPVHDGGSPPRAPPVIAPKGKYRARDIFRPEEAPRRHVEKYRHVIEKPRLWAHGPPPLAPPHLYTRLPVPAEMYLHLHSLSIFAFSVPGPFDFPSSRSRRARRL